LRGDELGKRYVLDLPCGLDQVKKRKITEP